MTATDATDGTKTAGTSPPIPVTNTPPTVVDDSYSMVQDRTLVVAAAGVLANDTDPEGQPLTVGHAATGQRARPRAAHPQRRRLVHLHAGRRLQRHGHVHLPGDRRLPDLDRRDRDDHGHEHRLRLVVGLVDELQLEPLPRG